MNPILSILIPTIPSRVSMFAELYHELNKQATYMNTFHYTLGSIEILVDGSAAFLDGGLSIGKKRQALVERATGKYLCFVDDDETVAPNYIETLVRLCQENSDVVTFRNISKLDGYWCLIDMSIHYENEEATPINTVRRRPWHICPVKSMLAKSFQFDDVNYGEDWAWFQQVLKFCTTESKSNAILHQYHHGAHSESDRILKQQANA